MSIHNRNSGPADVGRMREAIRGEVDTRVWLAMARVDDNPDAVRWEPELGWIVDVTFQSGDLVGEGPVACRVSDALGGNDQAILNPIPRCGSAIVLVTDGRINRGGVILGFTHSASFQGAGGCEVPETVNGDTIDEAKALAAHITVSPHDYDAQYGGDVRITVGTGQVMRLGVADPQQSYVRGEDLKATLEAIQSQIQQLSTATAGITGTGVVNPWTSLQAAWDVVWDTSVSPQYQAQLSEIIKGE